MGSFWRAERAKNSPFTLPHGEFPSFHLFPIYVFPELLDGISPELKKHMQGKSCFNFKTMDETLFAELAALAAAGIERFLKGGML